MHFFILNNGKNYIIIPVECRTNQFRIEAQTNKAQAHQTIVIIHLLDNRAK